MAPTPPPTLQPHPHRIRVGIDVGGTFTDAVAVDSVTLDLVAQVKVPTTHHHEDGVAHGIVEALDRLLKDVGRTPADVAFLAHGTTQATNALLEGDVAPVGLIGIGSGPGALPTRRLAGLASSNSPRANRFRCTTPTSPTPTTPRPSARPSTRSSPQGPMCWSPPSRSASTTRTANAPCGTWRASGDCR